MPGQDLLETFDRLTGQVRHPALTLDLFTNEPLDDSDDPVHDEPDEEEIRAALEPDALAAAQRRRGALMFAANLVFDHILDDLVVADAERERLALPRYVEEHLPSRMRRHYDAPLLRKLLATSAKVAQDLAGDEHTYPACTAEELVLRMVLQQWQMLLELTDLGPSWTDLSEYLFEDLDFEYLFEPDMDGIEDDPIAHKTSGIEVHALSEWFAPFNTDSRVHPYALDLTERGEPVLYDLTGRAEDSEHFTRTLALTEMPNTVTGLEPVSDLVAAARQDARTHRAPDQWVPDERDPARSFAETATRPITSGILIHQTGPDGDITQVPVLSFIPQPTHPSTGACWEEVIYFSGRTELPLAAVISFTPDPTVRERWNTAFAPPSP
jgi:hypothetical protein